MDENKQKKSNNKLGISFVVFFLVFLGKTNQKSLTVQIIVKINRFIIREKEKTKSSSSFLCSMGYYNSKRIFDV